MYKSVVSVAVSTRDGKLLFGRRGDDQRWTLPGGHLNIEEDIFDGAVRELFEEAGILVRPRDLVYLGSGPVSHKQVIVHSFSTTVNPDDYPDASSDPDHEIREWRWVDVSRGLPVDIRESLHNNPDITLAFLGLFDSSMQKSIRGLVASGLAAASLALSPSAVGAEPTETKWTAQGLHKDLHAIAHIESNFGVRLNHAKNSLGEYHTAHGAVGLKPVTGHEEYKRTPKLRTDFPGLDTASAFTTELKNNHEFYNAVASAHWNRLLRVTGSPEKAAYAWRWGVGAAAKASAEDVAGSKYVKEFQELQKKVVPQVVSTAKAASELLDLIKVENAVGGAEIPPKPEDKPMFLFDGKWLPMPSEEVMSQKNFPRGEAKYEDELRQYGANGFARPFLHTYYNWKYGNLWNLSDERTPHRDHDDAQRAAAQMLNQLDPKLDNQVNQIVNSGGVSLRMKRSEDRAGLDLELANSANGPWGVGAILDTNAIRGIVSDPHLTDEELNKFYGQSGYFATKAIREKFHKLYEDNQLHALNNIALISPVEMFFGDGIKIEPKTNFSDKVLDKLLSNNDIQFAFIKQKQYHRFLTDDVLRKNPEFIGYIARERALPEDVVSIYLSNNQYRDNQTDTAVMNNVGWNPSVHDQKFIDTAAVTPIARALLIGHHGTEREAMDFLKESPKYLPNVVNRLSPEAFKNQLNKGLDNRGQYPYDLESLVNDFDFNKRANVEHLRVLWDKVKSEPFNGAAFLGVAEHKKADVALWGDVVHTLHQQIYGHLNPIANDSSRVSFIGIENVLKSLISNKGTPSEVLNKYAKIISPNNVVSLADQFSRMSDEALSTIKSRFPDDPYDRIESEIKSRDPDSFHEEKVHVPFFGSNKYGMGRLRKLRDLVASKGGKVHKKDIFPYGELPPGILVKAGLFDHQGYITSDRIQSLIDSTPKETFNVSHTTHNGIQMHNTDTQNVFQLNLTTDMMKQMREADVLGTFRDYQEMLMRAHPLTPTSIGWVRYQHSYPGNMSPDDILNNLKDDWHNHQSDLVLSQVLGDKILKDAGINDKWFDYGVWHNPEHKIRGYRNDGGVVLDHVLKYDNELRAVDPDNNFVGWLNRGGPFGDNELKFSHKQIQFFHEFRKTHPDFLKGILPDDSSSGEFPQDHPLLNDYRFVRVTSINSSNDILDKKIKLLREHYDPKALPQYDEIKDLKPDGIHVDEIQSDLAVSPVQKAISEAKQMGYGEEETKDVIEKASARFPEEKWKKVKEILFKGRQPGEILHEAFHQHMRDTGRVGAKIHVWHYSSMVKRNLDQDKPAPAHYQMNYRDTPEKHGAEPAKYGELGVQNNPDLKGDATYVNEIRKKEDYEGIVGVILQKTEPTQEPIQEPIKTLIDTYDFRITEAMDLEKAENDISLKDHFDTEARKAKAQDDALKQELHLDHYSQHPHLSNIEPKYQGTGWTGAEKNRGLRIPRNYYYRADTEPETEFRSPRYYRYRVVLPVGAKLYDMETDPHNLLESKWEYTKHGMFYVPADFDEIEKHLKKKGYAGYHSYNPSIPNAIVLFHKHPAQQIHHPNAPLPALGLAKTESQPVNTKVITQMVRKALSNDLRKPKYQSHPNPMAGHCYVATQALWHLLGGPKSEWSPMWVSHENDSHWFLQHKRSGEILDPTVDQFETPPPYKRRNRVNGGWDTKLGPVPKGFYTGEIPDARTQTVLERILGPMQKSESFEIKVQDWLGKTDG